MKSKVKKEILKEYGPIEKELINSIAPSVRIAQRNIEEKYGVKIELRIDWRIVGTKENPKRNILGGAGS